MIDPNKIQDHTVTQSSRDGGRDGIGFIKLNQRQFHKSSYHLEAKRYEPEKSSVGVADTKKANLKNKI